MDFFDFFIIDEVQLCKDFEKAVNSLFLHPLIDIYITGSNAYMLSGELATLLSGRYLTIDMLPLSFSEYWQTVSATNISERSAFNQFVRFGGFPHATLLEQREDIVRPYLEGVYHTIVLKDIAQRADISDLTLLESIVKTLMSSVGSPASMKKIADTLTSTGRRSSPITIDKYVRALCDSYLFYKAERYDVKGRQYLKTQGKYYTVDTGMRNILITDSHPKTILTLDEIGDGANYDGIQQVNLLRWLL